MARINSSVVRKSKEICISLILGIFFSYVLTPYLENDCVQSFETDDLFNIESKVTTGSAENDRFSSKEDTIDLKDKSRKPSVVRPRYFSSELGIRDKLVVAVLTSDQSIRSMAVAVNKTSTHIVDKILFFIDAEEADKADVVSLKLQGIVGFIDTKRILKPFHTIKYLFENFIADYDFFFIMTDRTYLNARLLNKILKKVSVSEDLHIGPIKAGRDSNFCSLDGGILLSNSVVKKMGTSLDWCVKNTFSDSDNDNLGRCILHASSIPCKQFIQQLPFEGVRLPSENQLEFVNTMARRAVTYSPVKDPGIIYQLHYSLSKKELIDVKKTLKRESAAADQVPSGKIGGESEPWPPGSYPPTPPQTRFDLLRWTYFDLSNVYFPSSHVNIRPLQGAERIDIQNVVETSVSWLISKYKGELSYKRLVNGYMRFDPARGLDYILDLAFLLPASDRETIKRVECSKPLGKVEVLPLPYVTETSRVAILLPVRPDSAQQAIAFMKSYSHTFMAASELTFLLLVLLYDPSTPGKGHSLDVFKEVKEMAQDLTFKHRKDYSKIAWLSIKIPEIKPYGAPLYDDLLYFAITDLSMKKISQETLILFTDPYVNLSLDYVNRVRMNTIPGKLVFSPIPFMAYDPEVISMAAASNQLGNIGVPNANSARNGPELEIHKNTGHFNPHNFKHISFYPSDFFAARDSTKIPKVKYDRDIVTLYALQKEGKLSSLLELFSVHGGEVAIIRAPEPALKVKYGSIKSSLCNRAGLSKEHCLNEVIGTMGTRAQLADALLSLNKSITESSLV